MDDYISCRSGFNQFYRYSLQKHCTALGLHTVDLTLDERERPSAGRALLTAFDGRPIIDVLTFVWTFMFSFFPTTTYLSLAKIK